MNNQQYATIGSQLNPLNFQSYIKEQIDLALKEKVSGYSNKAVKSTFFNPEKIIYKDKDSGAKVLPQTVFSGIEGYEGVPPWKLSNELDPIMDAKKFSIAKSKYAQGSVSSDFMLYNHIYPEHQEEAKEYYSKLKYAAGAVMTSGDFSAIKQAQLLVSLVNLEELTYTLDQSFNTVQSGDIIVDIDTYHRFQLGGFDKGEFDTVDPIKGRYTTQRVLMRKAMGALEWSDEAMMMPWRHNVMGDHLQNLTSDFRRILVEKTAAEYTATTTETTGGGSLLAFETGTERSTINIYLLVGNAAGEIKAAPNFGRARTIAMNTNTWRKTLMNSWGRSLFSPVGVGQTQSTVIQGPRGLEDFTVYLDDVLPDGKIWVIDPSSAFIIQGPVMTENLRDSQHGSNSVIVRNWHKVTIVRPTQTRFFTAT